MTGRFMKASSMPYVAPCPFVTLIEKFRPTYSSALQLLMMTSTSKLTHTPIPVHPLMMLSHWPLLTKTTLLQTPHILNNHIVTTPRLPKITPHTLNVPNNTQLDSRTLVYPLDFLFHACQIACYKHFENVA
jgi:hypothetical protein